MTASTGLVATAMKALRGVKSLVLATPAMMVSLIVLVMFGMVGMVGMLAWSSPSTASAQTVAIGGGSGGGNAAIVYRKAFEVLGVNSPHPLLTQDELTELEQITAQGRISPIDIDRARELLAKAQPFLEAIAPAGSIRRSDFELDRAAGIEMLLPHLGPMRTAARLLQGQAALALHDGDWEMALGLQRSLSALGPHAGQDGAIVSSMAGSAMGRLAMGPLDVMLDDGSLTQDRAKALSEVLRGLKGNDPFDFSKASRGEFQILAATIGSKTPAEVAAMLRRLDLDPGAIGTLTRRELSGELARAGELHRRAADAFASNDPVAARRAMAEIEQEVERSTLFAALMPSFAKALEHKIQANEEIEQRLERIDAIAKGEKQAIEVANASTWLRRAAALAASLPDEGQDSIELVRFLGRDTDPVLRERAERLFLGAGRGIRMSLERGVACGLVDLDTPNDGDFGLSMGWLPGLRAACRVMLAEATLLETTAAAERAALVLGVARVLMRDPSVTRSLTARSIIEETKPLLERLVSDTALSSEERRTLALLLRELAASEGFRMSKGLEADRDRLATGAPYLRVIDPQRRTQLVRRGADFALFLQVALAPEDAWVPRSTDAAAPSAEEAASIVLPQGILVRSDDLLPPGPVAEARRQREVIAALPFFRTHGLAVGDKEREARQPFRGVTAVPVRTYGTDLAQAAETASSLSDLASRLER
ncbi:MAG: hypothetical protein KF724_00475 [Phycisphaeraceae bacterium]|nr:hypothetical protein [Phycisphaeraceae bacterium]